MKRTINTSKHTVVAVSGGFDPMHIGHMRMIHEASKLGSELIVILNNDNWLMQKKGFVFMPQAERRELLEGVRGVSKVVLSFHKKHPKDMGVRAESLKITPDPSAPGGDKTTAQHLPPQEA